MATFHTDEGFFTAINAVNQAGQGETAGTHAMPLLKGEGWKERGVTECSEENKQSWATFRSFRGALNEICSSEIPGHISFKHIGDYCKG